jgi:hypothetical protein
MDQQPGGVVRGGAGDAGAVQVWCGCGAGIQACAHITQTHISPSTIKTSERPHTHTPKPNQQMLFIGYQRFSLDRQRRRRRDAIAKMQRRSVQLKEAMAAATAAKRAREAAAAAAVASGDAAAAAAAAEQGEAAGALPFASDAAGSGSAAAAAGGKGAAGLDEQLSPAAKVMLSDLDFRRTAGSAAAAFQDAQREADLAEIRAALSDAPAAAAAAATAAAAEAGSSSSGSKAEAEAADARLFALLSDMMRSPEGRGVVKRFKEATGSSDDAAGSSGSSGGGSSGGGEGEGDDVTAYINELLSDPATKARLVRELEARLCAIAEAEEEAKEKAGAKAGGKARGGGGEGGA